MFCIRKPSEKKLRAFLESQRDRPFSYAETGLSRLVPPSDFTVDHNRIELGRGEEVFRRGTTALEQWRMFDLGWVEIVPRCPRIEPGTTVAVLAKWTVLWSLNACRIVYVIDEPRRRGFAYGTLPEHAERGEERFSIEWRDDDSVWYEVLSFSRPNQWAARVGYVFTRRLQKRFALDSVSAMARAAGARES